MAGILIGPTTPGFVADLGLSSQLAEIAIPGAALQIAAATALGTGD